MSSSYDAVIVGSGPNGLPAAIHPVSLVSPLFAVTPEIATQSGLLRRDWQRKGHTLSYTDVTIAAVAIAHGLA